MAADPVIAEGLARLRQLTADLQTGGFENEIIRNEAGAITGSVQRPISGDRIMREARPKLDALAGFLADDPPGAQADEFRAVALAFADAVVQRASPAARPAAIASRRRFLPGSR